MTTLSLQQIIQAQPVLLSKPRAALVTILRMGYPSRVYSDDANMTLFDACLLWIYGGITRYGILDRDDFLEILLEYREIVVNDMLEAICLSLEEGRCPRAIILAVSDRQYLSIATQSGVSCFDLRMGVRATDPPPTTEGVTYNISRIAWECWLRATEGAPNGPDQASADQSGNTGHHDGADSD